MERRRHPVGRSANGRTCRHTFFIRRVPGQKLRAAVGTDTTRPRQLLHERTAQEHLPVRAIEHVEEAVAIGLQQQFARRSLERGINQQQRLLRIPVPQIVRRELKVPAKLARLRVERDNRVRIQVVSLTAAAIGVRVRVSSRPEERPRLRIVAAWQPRRTAALLEIGISLPRFRARLSTLGHGPETPRLIPRLDVICGEKASNPHVAARHTSDDEISDDQRRRRSSVWLFEVFRKHDFPEQRPVRATDRQKVRVVGDQKYARSEYRYATVEPDARITTDARGSRTREAPHLSPRCRIESRDLIRRAHIHDAVEHQRRRLVVEPAQRMHPPNPQPAHVHRVDLRVRAVSIAVKSSVISRPVARLRLEDLIEVPRTCRTYRTVAPNAPVAPTHLRTTHHRTCRTCHPPFALPASADKPVSWVRYAIRLVWSWALAFRGGMMDPLSRVIVAVRLSTTTSRPVMSCNGST